MKRKNDFIWSINSIGVKENKTNKLRHKKERTTARHEPPMYIKNAMTLDKWVVAVLRSKLYSGIDSNEMQIDSLTYLTFIIFLGAQGKEYIGDIQKIRPQCSEFLIFVSLNMQTKLINGRSISCIDDENCKMLASYFDILDPLGGGVYPLDYLVVADKSSKVRCKVPIQICRSRQGHQKFCIDISQLKGFLEEYSIFASHDLVGA